jgi:hypothetical protein
VVMIVAATASATALLLWRGAATTAPILMASLLWHGAVAGVLVWWTARAWMKLPAPHECQGCGYDLRGLAAGDCPECGATRDVGEAGNTLAP